MRANQPLHPLRLLTRSVKAAQRGAVTLEGAAILERTMATEMVFRTGANYGHNMSPLDRHQTSLLGVYCPSWHPPTESLHLVIIKTSLEGNHPQGHTAHTDGWAARGP